MGCDTADSTCNGGFMDDDFAFAEKNGPCTEASHSYPFTTRYASNAKDLAVRDVASRAVTISCDDQMECSSPFMRSRNSCEDQPCVTGDRFVAGFAHQAIADAGVEVRGVQRLRGMV